jgi:hypothetical protein
MQKWSKAQYWCLHICSDDIPGVMWGTCSVCQCIPMSTLLYSCCLCIYSIWQRDCGLCSCNLDFKTNNFGRGAVVYHALFLSYTIHPYWDTNPVPPFPSSFQDKCLMYKQTVLDTEIIHFFQRVFVWFKDRARKVVAYL